MTHTQQTEALNLEEFRAKVTRAAREPLLARIAELEAQLAAIGAGGVEPLRKQAAVPQGWKLVQIELLERIQESLGSYLSDHGWSQSDMDAADALDGLLAAVPQPPACNQSMQPELATYSAQARNKKRNRAMNAEQAIDAEIKRQEAELQRLREEKAAIVQEENHVDKLFDAVLNCPHSITHESVTLHFYPRQKEGHNALSQLHHRLAAADAAAKAREMELLAVIEDLERLIPQINRGGTP